MQVDGRPKLQPLLSLFNQRIPIVSLVDFKITLLHIFTETNNSSIIIVICPPQNYKVIKVNCIPWFIIIELLVIKLEKQSVACPI